MEKSLTHGLPSEFLSELERKYFWWGPVCSEVRSPVRNVAQAMNYADFADIRRMEQTLGHDFHTHVMLCAEPEWIGERYGSFGAAV